MKTLLFTCFLALLASTVAGQGVVDFRNSVSFATPGDRNVYQWDGTLLKGSQWLARLYYANGADQSVDTLAAVGDAAPFRSLASTGPGGVWITLTPLRVLPDTPPGETATLQVRIWDSSMFADYDAARHAGMHFTQSAPFNYTPLAPEVMPDDAYFMHGLGSFPRIVVPEPSTLAIVGLGWLAFTRWSRRIRSR